MNDKEKLKELLGNRKRRITKGRLYKIKNKDGKVVPFIPNPAQLDLITRVHNKNLILKARQLGFSTLIQILMLDQALFNKNMACGVIAHGKDVAKRIFEDKIKFAYDNLPQWLKESVVIKKNNSDTLEFDNGSSIYVSVSFRGGTLQYLHVSEYGKICAKYPDRAKEINSGALEAVGAGNYVFIESTAEGKSGDFYNKSTKSERLMNEGKQLNEHEYKFFFYPWHHVKEYRLHDPFLTLTTETLKYFKDLEEEYDVKVDEDQMKWYQVKADEKMDEMLREYPSVPEEAFKVAIAGSYYKKWITKAIKGQRVCAVPYDPTLELYIGMDIGGAGGGDDMTVWFFQVFGKEFRFVDYWEGSGFSMQDLHTEVLKNKPYNYAKVFMPHDARVHSQNDGKTREETMKELGYKVEVLANKPGAISERIQTVRENFQYYWFDKERCGNAVDKLAEYRRKWNESIGDFLDTPEHANSHCADGFGYSVLGLLTTLKSSHFIEQKAPTFFNKMEGQYAGPNANRLNSKQQRFGI